MRSGRNGRSQKRMPVASASALAISGAIRPFDLSTQLDRINDHSCVGGVHALQNDNFSSDAMHRDTKPMTIDRLGAIGLIGVSLMLLTPSG